jgi:hypothetical protein
MATDLIVPNLHKDSEPSLQELEAMIGPGVLPEHRAILLKALTQTSGRAFLLTPTPSANCARGRRPIRERCAFSGRPS